MLLCLLPLFHMIADRAQILSGKLGGSCVTCVIHIITNWHHVLNATDAVEIGRQVVLQECHLPPPGYKGRIGNKGCCKLP